MRKCRFCAEPIEDAVVVCPHCAEDLIPSRSVHAAHVIETPPAAPAARISETFFVIVAWLIALGSWLFVSQATSGVAGLCFACFLAIAVRLAQADRHHKELLLSQHTRDSGS
jgi:hypothetical protein